MASKVQVAIVLILATLVPIGRVTSNADVMLHFPAIDTPNATPGWPNRYLRSTESLTTTNESNAEERGFWSEFVAKMEWGKRNVDILPLVKEESETVPLITKENEKVKASEKKRKNILSDNQALKTSQKKFILREDDEVKRLVKKMDNIKSVTTILKEKYFQRWVDVRRSAEEIHNLLGLPIGPALLESPLVWIWLDYVICIKRTSNFEEPIAFFVKMFGNNIEVAKMFEGAEKVFMDKDHGLGRLKEEFLLQWLKYETDWDNLLTNLELAGFTNDKILYYKTLYDQFNYL
ncbi:unnamed protein product [Peronospora farinosa]|uniref:RxLR effector protein n=1 Tax=Peronospora farinosa TaxID=134698 RepID=A0ABN8BY37_9STRA|nr:unnamed protein product [Peronospora farinosa]